MPVKDDDCADRGDWNDVTLPPDTVSNSGKDEDDDDDVHGDLMQQTAAWFCLLLVLICLPMKPLSRNICRNFPRLIPVLTLNQSLGLGLSLSLR